MQATISNSSSLKGLDFLIKSLGIALVPICLYLVLPQSEARYNFEVGLFSVSAIIGLAGASIWAKKDSFSYSLTIQYAIEVLVRFSLAHIFMTYGLGKIYGVQFPLPSEETLAMTLGEFTGQELTWAYFGWSFPYTAFVGLGQVLSAFLLFYRRTQLLGAIVLLPIIGNIVAVNFAYDIGVKFYSVLYLIMTLYLILVESGRLWAFLLANKTVEKRPELELSTKMKRAAFVVQHVAILFIIGFNVILFERVTRSMGG